MNNNISNFVIYQSGNDDIKVDILVNEDTLWMTQKEISNLFDVSKSTISEHFSNIFNEQELNRLATVRKFRTVQQEGNRSVSREMEYYNLDAIISVGYRVNSIKATQFRMWATQTLKEFIIKGFVLDDNRLRQGTKILGNDYFRELLERVRSIRASERRIYQKITDIFAECSIDYNKNSQISKQFYAMVQNKFHYAISGQTAAEIIYTKADKTKDNMGLTTWANSPNGRILKSDVIIAKNYLQEKEIKNLERTVTSYFDYIEGIIERKQALTMADLAESVDKFLAFNEYKILDNKGKISHKQAKEKAELEYMEFNKTQKILSDFDKMLLEKKYE
ncbi:virulence RhuM family protein [Fusobacterium sp.]|uniref:virulence RhuM family protein n=1 Tax=Fusobacterium sp. TaxID=68766 RepID=UPI0025C5AD38|nr:virulence RhuM family protein [Fusobacterium sp.]MCI5724955.1 virulence RhuM family protein [Fusobacterium sp.]MCI7224199.1 virulence RhuM family protein [Fusobacterium sp.]